MLKRHQPEKVISLKLISYYSQHSLQYLAGEVKSDMTNISNLVELDSFLVKKLSAGEKVILLGKDIYLQAPIKSTATENIERKTLASENCKLCSMIKF